MADNINLNDLEEALKKTKHKLQAERLKREAWELKVHKQIKEQFGGIKQKFEQMDNILASIQLQMFRLTHPQFQLQPSSQNAQHQPPPHHPLLQPTSIIPISEIEVLPVKMTPKLQIPSTTHITPLSSTSSFTPARSSATNLKVTCVGVTEMVETKLEVVADENEKILKQFRLVPKDTQLLGEEMNEFVEGKDSMDIPTIESRIHQTQKVFDEITETESGLKNEDKCHLLDHIGELKCWDDDLVKQTKEMCLDDHISIRMGVDFTTRPIPKPPPKPASTSAFDYRDEEEFEGIPQSEMVTESAAASSDSNPVQSSEDWVEDPKLDVTMAAKQSASDQLKKMFEDHDRELEVQRKNLKQKEQELKEREAHNENENLRLNYEKKQNELAILELKRADEKMLSLAEEHKREKEELQIKMIDLERKLDAKQALELEIRRLTGNLKVVKHRGDDGDKEVLEKLHVIQQEPEEKEDEFEHLEQINQALIVKERKSNDELQEVRKELIYIFKEQPVRATIGVKRMGELSSEAFLPAAKRMYSDDEAEVRAAELCLQWESRIGNPNWHPFKIIPVEGGKSCKTILDEEDRDLSELRNEFGKEAYHAVSTALLEMNEYNPSGSVVGRFTTATVMLGVVPPRFNWTWTSGEIGFSTYFSMTKRNAYVPADLCILLILESSRVEIDDHLNELVYLKYEVSKCSASNSEAFLGKLRNLGVAFSLVERIIKLISKFGKNEESNSAPIINESTLIKMMGGLNETIGVVLDYLQDAKDHGDKKGDDLLASARVIGSYLAEAPSACKEKVEELLDYMLSIEGEDGSSPFHSISFLLLMLCQITMKKDGCKLFASTGAFGAVVDLLISLIYSSDSSIDNSSTILLAYDTILNFLLKKEHVCFTLENSCCVKLLQALSRRTDETKDNLIADLFVGLNVCDWEDRDKVFVEDEVIRRQIEMSVIPSVQSFNAFLVDVLPLEEGNISMLVRPPPKPPPQFQHMSLEDKTLSRGEYCHDTKGLKKREVEWNKLIYLKYFRLSFYELLPKKLCYSFIFIL